MIFTKHDNFADLVDDQVRIQIENEKDLKLNLNKQISEENAEVEKAKTDLIKK